MNWFTRVLRPASVLIVALWLIQSFSALGAPSALTTVNGGFVRDDGPVNTPPGNAGAPSLALGSLAGNAANLVPWLAFEQRSSGSAQDIFVKTFNATTGQWVLRGTAQNGGSLNLDRTVEAEHPSIDFAGAVVNGLRTVPWTAWYEPVHAFGDKTTSSQASL